MSSPSSVPRFPFLFLLLQIITLSLLPHHPHTAEDSSSSSRHPFFPSPSPSFFLLIIKSSPIFLLSSPSHPFSSAFPSLPPFSFPPHLLLLFIQRQYLPPPPPPLPLLFLFLCLAFPSPPQPCSEIKDYRQTSHYFQWWQPYITETAPERERGYQTVGRRKKGVGGSRLKQNEAEDKLKTSNSHFLLFPFSLLSALLSLSQTVWN